MIKERDCTNIGDKLQNVCRRYRIFDSELCVCVSVERVAKKVKYRITYFISNRVNYTN